MCEVMLLTSEANVQYETGFYTTARRPKQIGPNAVILAGKDKYFLIPEKWRMQVEESVHTENVSLVTYPNTAESYYSKLAELIGSGQHGIGIEYDGIDLKTFLHLKKAFPGSEFSDISREMEKKRLIKRPDEISALRHAARVAVDAMEFAKHCIKPGMTEYRCAAEIQSHMLLHGSDGVPFTMKALSGENSSVITRVPGNKAVREGEFILLDFGAKVDGYSSDWTRTFALGKETAEMRKLYETVFQMERRLISCIRPGLPLACLVEEAQKLAADSKYSEYYNPHLGHSIGITSHEWPIIEPGVQGELKENMVITIEPGIYVPGVGGVRIEDEILVTRAGYEIITGLEDENHIIAKRQGRL